MQPVRSFADLTARLRGAGRRYRLAVACGEDAATAEAVARAVAGGFAVAVFVGRTAAARALPCLSGLPDGLVRFVEAGTPAAAAAEAVRLVRTGEADVLVKGLLHTSVLLRAVLDKERGLLPPGRVLTHVAAAEMPAYHKLLFATDVAVIPYPTPVQRAAQLGYLLSLLHTLGVEEPRVALVHCAETVSEKFPHTASYADLCRRAAQGEWGRAVVDGPLDLRTACDPAALRAKGIRSPLRGDADGLVLPDLEAGNVLYKALSLFARARVAGMLCGASAPVVLPSRGDDAEAKFLSLALAALAANP